MRYLLKLLLIIVLFVTLLVPQQLVSAEDYITDTVEALKTSKVYVAPGTPGTDYNTATELQVFLNDNDNIVLVMLPAEAKAGTDVYTIAMAISEGLDNQKILGLSVGREVIGYSPLLPERVASDLMNRADSVSNSPITALVTFSQNIQKWYMKNPQPSATPTPVPTPTPRPTRTPIVLPKVDDVPVLGKILFWTFIAAAITTLGVRTKNTAKQRKRNRSLKQMELQIQEVQENVDKIRETKVREDLTRACQAAKGLLGIFQRTDTQLGYTEAKLPALLANVNKQVIALVRHESGRRPLPAEFLDQMKSVLLSYDTLFIKLQENDPEAAGLLASIFDSSNTMLSSLGYLPEDEN